MATDNTKTIGRATASILLAALMAFALVPVSTSRAQTCEDGTVCEKPKDACFWEINGVTWPLPALLPAGAGAGTQVITLRCPNHIELAEPQYGYKDCRFPVNDLKCISPAGDVTVQDLGRVDDVGSDCGWSRTWAITSPSANLYTFWFRVHTLKDADCDKKPDDWNQDVRSPLCPGLTWSECPGFSDHAEPNIWRQTNDIPPKVVNYGDGTLDGNPCHWHNSYYSGRLQTKPPAGGGTFDPRAPGYFPAPDGEVNECDWQNYEIQWRQWN